MKTWLPLIQTRFLTIRFHYTWLFLVALGLWSLGKLVLPQRLGDNGAVWLGAVLIILVYVGLVAVHEAAHLLVARLLRVPMPPLNIYPIGTLARIGHETVGPRQTFVVAAAGPLVNILLWFGLRAVDTVPGTLGGELINFARSFTFTLGLINLMPALPLDGGRMLRALIWHNGTFEQGTRTATMTGYAVIGLTFLVGVVSITSPVTMLRGVWILLLAWLLYAAGTMLTRRRVVATLFNRMTVRDVMVPAPLSVEPKLSLRELTARWRGEMGENPTPVVEDGRLVGLITRSLVVDVPQGYWDERTVGETMQTRHHLNAVSPLEPIGHLLTRLDAIDMQPSPFLVVEDERLLGVVEPRDVEPLLDLHDVLGMSHAVSVDASSAHQSHYTRMQGKDVEVVA